MSAKEVIKNLQSVRKNLVFDSFDLMSGMMKEAEAWAKENAPWTDRTGIARKTIFGIANKETGRVVGYIGIGVDYGVFLELCNDGKYRIIRPTMLMLRSFIQGELKFIKLRK